MVRPGERAGAGHAHGVDLEPAQHGPHVLEQLGVDAEGAGQHGTE